MILITCRELWSRGHPHGLRPICLPLGLPRSHTSHLTLHPPGWTCSIHFVSRPAPPHARKLPATCFI